MRRREAHPRIPEALGALLGRLPQRPPSAALAAVLNLALVRQFEGAALQRLHGKTVRIIVRDARIRFTLGFDGSRFLPRASDSPADVTIIADLHDFGMLALRKEDPDTLFFARRLRMEGDTELGLVVRNMLDGVDLAALARRFEAPAAFLRRVRGRLPLL